MKTFKRFVIFALVITFSAYWLVATPIFTFDKGKISYPYESDCSADSLKQHVTFLCSTPQFRNYQNLESLNFAADYIKHRLELYSNNVTEQHYKAYDNEYKNIIASFGPEEGERIVIGAHYDVCGDQMGADDNASGIAGLLELARLLAKEKLNYRVDIVAYTLEEPPFFRTELMGSAIHAKFCSENNIDIKAMICLEMIGYFNDEKGSQDYPIKALKVVYPNKGNFIAVVGKLGKGKLTRHMKRNMKKGSDIPVVSISAPASLPGIDFSDHLNYWAFDYDAIMITNTAFYRNKSYHEITDTPDRLDYTRMSEVVKGVFFSVLNFD